MGATARGAVRTRFERKWRDFERVRLVDEGSESLVLFKLLNCFGRDLMRAEDIKIICVCFFYFFYR
jgi:hypothetical protein